MKQGNPLGPFLFCNTLQSTLQSLTSELNLGYLHDLTLGGLQSEVAKDVHTTQYSSHPDIVLEPYLARWSSIFWPDRNGSAITNQTIFLGPTRHIQVRSTIDSWTHTNKQISQLLHLFILATGCHLFRTPFGQRSVRAYRSRHSSRNFIEDNQLNCMLDFCASIAF